MKNYWVISDTHFGHHGVTKFLKSDGSKLRPYDTIEEMDDALVDNWNSLIKPNDRVYHLGDVVINRRALPTLDRLNGKKVLIRGNHDIFRLSEYTQYFEDVRSYKILSKERIIMSHIPVHPDQLSSRWVANVHGHLHGNILEDQRYINVCVEQTNFKPISLDDIIDRISKLNL